MAADQARFWYTFRPDTWELLLFRDRAGAARYALGLPASAPAPPTNFYTICKPDGTKLFQIGCVFPRAWVSVHSTISLPDSQSYIVRSDESQNGALSVLNNITTLGPPTAIVGSPDGPTGAAYHHPVIAYHFLPPFNHPNRNSVYTWRLYHRPQPLDSGPDYCAQVVRHLAAPDVLPIANLPEFIAYSYL